MTRAAWSTSPASASSRAPTRSRPPTHRRPSTTYFAESQTYFAEETKEYPLAAGVKTAEGVPPLETLQPPKIDLGKLDSLKETLAMLQEAGLV